MNSEIRFYSERQLLTRLTISRSTLWRLVKKGDFPNPISISPGRKGYETEAADEAIAAMVTNANTHDGENGGATKAEAA